MDFLGARIQLNPRPVQRTKVALEVGALGHCPGQARLDRLIDLTGILDDMRQAGFGDRVESILAQSEIDGFAYSYKDLYHLPIPLRSSAEFDDIFPDARTVSSQYNSVLAGDKAWLPQTVDDFFANGGEKLWLVRIPEAEGVRGFLPHYQSPYDKTIDLRGVACLLSLSALALIVLPDLERLQIPTQLPDIPRKRLDNPHPRFLPLGTLIDDGHRERRYGSELPQVNDPLPLLTILRDLLTFTASQRPDIQYLFTLPLSYSTAVASPCVDPDDLAALTTASVNPDAYLLRQVQLLFPYLRGRDEELRSPVGVIAGAIAASAKALGVWRSIAGVALVSQAQPFPQLNMQQTIALRDQPGIGILNQRVGQLTLDDECLVVPALQRDDYVPALVSQSERLRSARSSEVVRFLGYLVRELQALGERLIFNTDATDPRPLLMLQSFFRNLYRAGALRGAVVEDAFSITRASAAENVIAFDIEIAPAYPIDKIVVTFINRDGEWASGVRNV